MAVSYTHLDEFTTNEANPVTTPRTCEPGPGTIVITDTDALFSIASNKLTLNDTLSGYSLFYATIPWVAGTVFEYEIDLDDRAVVQLHHNTSLTEAGTYSFQITSASNVYVRESSAGTVFHPMIDTPLVGKYRWVMRENNGAFLIKDDELLWVTIGRSTYATMYGGAMFYSGRTYSATTIDNLKVYTSSGSDINSDYTLANGYSLTPSSGDTITGTADGIFRVRWRPQTDETATVLFRRSSDTDCMKLVCDQAASTIKLYEVASGVETEIDTGKTQTWTVDTEYTITAQTWGEKVQTRVDLVIKHNTTSTNQQTATGMKVSSDATIPSFLELVSWPRDLTGFPDPTGGGLARTAQTWYVSATATGGNGSSVSPWTLATGLTHDLIVPGDTVQLAAGTYGDFDCSKKGTAASPITYEASGRATIDGYITLGSAENVHLKGFEIDDTVSYAETRPEDISTGTAGYQPGENCKLINCIVKNHQQGASGGNALDDWELYGCIFIFNGTDSVLGHGTYMQHNNTDGDAKITQCIIGDNFGYGIHCYGTSALKNFQITDNIVFNTGTIRDAGQRNILLGGTGGIYSSHVNSNTSSHVDEVVGILLGWSTGNDFEEIECIDNVVSGYQSLQLHDEVDDVDEPNPEMTLTGNELYGTVVEFDPDKYPDNTYGTYANTPDGHELYHNAYDETRAHVAIFNIQAGADTADVDVSSVFGTKGTVDVHNVQDYWNDIQELTISEGVISVNMEATNRTVESPIGWDDPDKTFPDFGAFVLYYTEPENEIPEGEYEMDHDLFTFTYALASLLGGLRTGVVNSGSTTTIVDATRRKENDDYFNEGTIWVLYDAGGAAAAPEGEFAIVSDFVQSTGTLTFEAITAAVAANDRYAVAPAYYPLDMMIEKINLALSNINVVVEDTTSLDTVAGQTEYDLPAAVLRGDLRRVYIQSTSDSDDNRWSELGDWDLKVGTTGNVDTLIIPPGYPSGKDLRLVYIKRHDPVWFNTSAINEAVHRDRVIYRAAEHMMVELMNENDGKPTLGELANYYRDKADDADHKHKIDLPKRHSNVTIIKS